MGRITVLGLLLTGAVYLRAGTFTAFGPKDYVRGSGSPVTVTDTFSVLNPTTQYTLKVFNGGLENSQTELVSSSIVSVNGLQVIGPSNFNQNVKEVDVPIILQTANTLSVQVRGQPGGTLAIQIVGVDSDPPVIKSTISPLPNAAGWNNSKVTVTFTCTDSTSGVATCPQAQTVTADGASQVISGTATDNAGNSASTSVTVNLDQTAPSIRAAVSPAANAAGWNNTNLTVAFTCLDVTSGVASCPPPQTVSSEGPNQIVSGTVADIAGNTASTSITINLDKSSPTIQAAGSPPANAAGWNTGTVTVSFTCADSISGIAACPQNQTVSSDGANQIVSGSATDQAGNMASTSFTVNLDETPPILGATVSPTPNAAGWNNTNATVTFACNDSISGVASCPPPQTITSEVAGLAVSGTATDVAGNSTSTSVTVNVDKTPPIIVVNSPTDRSTLPAGTPSILVSGTGSDSVSGVAAVTCNGAPASLSGSNFSCMVPLSAGPNSISVQAKDIAGNANNSLVNVTVTTATAPQITIKSPANLSVTNFSPVSVNGTVSDPAATLAINGIPVPQSSGSFSIPVPLVEGLNVLTAVATAASGITGTATVQVTLDTTPPHLSIDSPSDKAITTDATVTVTGSVNDIVPGTVNNQEAQVIVNGITAQVANRTYLAANVPLGLGANTIQATARDRAGNAATVSIGVTRVSASQPPAPTVGQAVVTNSLSIVSGNNQTASIGTQLPTPLAVLLSDASGHPVPDQPVVFKVTGNNGTVSAGGAAGSSLTVNTDANGLAQAAWTLGQRSGVGVNRLEVSSAVAIAPLNFNAIAMAGSPSAIVIDSGDNQTGIAGQALAFPLVVVVTDGGHNRIANVPVTFTASGGGGSLNGAPSQVINTDSDGRALAVLTLGPAAGTSNNTVEATFPGNPGSPVAFIGSAKIAGDPLKTTISGVVLDNTNTPIANATI
ncbi:MAG TPA: hypothetical protein VG498_18815, partial [Terriglobales bacterium]|nr:hypothetical protein [Terriglobales bacterium]